MKKTNRSLRVSIAVALFATGAAYAQIPPSDILFCGPTAQQTVLPEGGGAGSELLLNWCPANGPSGVLPGLINLFEPGTSILSDQVWVANTVSGFFLNFASDPDLQTLTGMPVLANLDETGAPQDLSAVFGLPPGWFTVQSDVGDTSDSVPEPETLTFAAPFIVAMMCRRLRRGA